MTMDRHEEIQALLADYALGELLPPDRARAEAHMATCAGCTAEVREVSLAFHSLAFAEEPVSPPDHLRARVLASLAAERPMGTPRDASTAPKRTPAAGRAWLALAATIAVVLGGLLALVTARATRLDQELQRLEADRTRLVQEIATTTGQADRVVAILTAPDLRRIDLDGFEASREATACAYWSVTQGLLIVADQLPPPPAGREYQVWLIGAGSPGPVNAGLMEGQGVGRGMLIAPPPPDVAPGPVTVAVTDEPPGGLRAPTGSKHLAGSI
ncbi:anti-sigma factor [soil metagenome]